MQRGIFLLKIEESWGGAGGRRLTSPLTPSQSFDPTTPKFLFVISLRYPLNFAKISLNFNPKRMQKLSGEHRRYTVTLIGLTYLPDFNLPTWRLL